MYRASTGPPPRPRAVRRKVQVSEDAEVTPPLPPSRKRKAPLEVDGLFDDGLGDVNRVSKKVKGVAVRKSKRLEQSTL